MSTRFIQSASLRVKNNNLKKDLVCSIKKLDVEEKIWNQISAAWHSNCMLLVNFYRPFGPLVTYLQRVDVSLLSGCCHWTSSELEHPCQAQSQTWRLLT